MTEAERIQKINNQKFAFEKCMLEMSCILLKLRDLGAEAALNYEMDGDHGTISLICKPGQAPPGLLTNNGAMN